MPDVLNRRLLRLPERTVTALRGAAVIGRRFDTATLATVTGVDEDDLLDLVEPAQAAGLVREDGIDQYPFAHALVRDTLSAQMSASRRARLHARVAEALTGSPGRETEVARHWLEAGPSYADRAWRAAADAAAVARRFYAHDQAADLLREALGPWRTTAEPRPARAVRPADAADRGLPLGGRSPSWSAPSRRRSRSPSSWATPELVAAGRDLHDPGRCGGRRPHGASTSRVVEALRGSLDRLPPEDGDLRCRVLLALANELDDGAASRSGGRSATRGWRWPAARRPPAPAGRLPDRVRRAVGAAPRRSGSS